MSIDSAKADTPPLDGTQRKKSTPRPSMQIYRPPGLRNPGSVPKQTNGSSKSSDETAAATASPEPKMVADKGRPNFSKNSESPKPNNSYQATTSKSSKQNESQQNSHQQNNNNNSQQSQQQRSQQQQQQPSIARTLSNVISDSRKKPQIQNNFDEIIQIFQKLNITKEKSMIDEFISTNMENESLARSLGQYLVQYAIEENKANGRTVARLCAALLECPSGVAFHQGLVTSILQYYDCREQLRNAQEHLKTWIGFLSFVSDLYAHVGFTYEGEMVEVIFNIFDYMLKPPVLEQLKIEELECMIASLLSVGYDLERQCPDELGRLKNQIRDAFIEVSEPWARKMILLLMELSASGWSLPTESNDYYFS
uniref:MIF4G domain-containing protein n=1 Tax=Panagrolaimus sp. ES5 TaxID=591445 RepID=A0AC34FBP2_9BILA